MTNNYHLTSVDKIEEISSYTMRESSSVQIKMGNFKEVVFFVETSEQAQKLAEAFEMVKNATPTT